MQPRNWQKTITKAAKRVGKESVTPADVFHELRRNGIDGSYLPTLEDISKYLNQEQKSEEKKQNKKAKKKDK